MRRKYRTDLLLTRIALIALIWGLQACATGPIEESDPAKLFQQAEEEIQSDHYILATDHLKSLRNKFPYSQFAPLAQLRLADVYFLQESFGEAASAYETFRDLYPKHEKSSYALFRAAKSYYKDAPEQIARDLGSANRALESYREFVKKYPADPLKDEAQKDLLSAEDRLARKEKYIADFYRTRGQLKAARARLEGLLSLYPQTPTAEEAKKDLQEMSQQ
jgi:outer membrane protein assembly factor BamD